MAYDYNSILWRLYANAPFLVRFLAGARGFICPWQKLWQPLASRVGETPRIFDIGCGVGAWLNVLARLKLASGFGIDNNSAAIAIAQKTSQENSLGNSFAQVDSPNQWPEEGFSVISMIDVMHHINPAIQDAFFLTAARRVPAGRYLLYKDMAPRPWLHSAWNQLHDLVLARQWIHNYPIERAETLAKQADLVLVFSDDFKRGPYAHELRLWQREA